MSYMDLTSEDLHKLLRCDFERGHLFWRERPVEMFRDDRRFKAETRRRIWNSKHAGKRALAVINGHGYPSGTLLNETVVAHRIIFCMAHGYWPVMVDHSDGNTENNSIHNLREVFSDAENMANRKLRINNSSGHIGVSREGRKWKVRVRDEYIGAYSDFDEAVAAQLAAARERGFHVNHGRK